MRRKLDFYETASWHVDALVDNLPELSGTILCPCVGDGALMNRLIERRSDLDFVTNDILATGIGDFTGDATKRSHWEYMIQNIGYRPDWIVENPPFKVEIDILKHAWTFCKVGVVFMARTSFTEPTKDEKKRPRGPWLSAHPYQKRITLERYSFTNNGKSDSTTTDWLVWSKKPVKGPFGISAFGYKDGSAQREGGYN